jgi:hypothetical protein
MPSSNGEAEGVNLVSHDVNESQKEPTDVARESPTCSVESEPTHSTHSNTTVRENELPPTNTQSIVTNGTTSCTSKPKIEPACETPTEEVIIPKDTGSEFKLKDTPEVSFEAKTVCHDPPKESIAANDTAGASKPEEKPPRNAPTEDSIGDTASASKPEHELPCNDPSEECVAANDATSASKAEDESPGTDPTKERIDAIESICTSKPENEPACIDPTKHGIVTGEAHCTDKLETERPCDPTKESIDMNETVNTTKPDAESTCHDRNSSAAKSVNGCLTAFIQLEHLEQVFDVDFEAALEQSQTSSVTGKKSAAELVSTLVQNSHGHDVEFIPTAPSSVTGESEIGSKCSVRGPETTTEVSKPDVEEKSAGSLKSGLRPSAPVFIP